MIIRRTASLLLAPLLLGAASPDPAPAVPSPSEIVAAAPAGDWVDIAPSDLLLIDVKTGRDGTGRIVIQLLPAPFSQGWVGNIRRLAAAHWWDATSINRVQDDYVVQWGDASEKKPVPAGLAVVPQSGYEQAYDPAMFDRWWIGGHDLPAPYVAKGHLPAPTPPAPIVADPYAQYYAFSGGFAFGVSARQSATSTEQRLAPDRVWPLHCYAMVGVGRDLPPDAGTGAELYAVIGHAPRQLDRNIALVGRVVSGIERLSSLPRGTGPLGFYETAGERVPIVSVRLASDLPEGERPHLQYLSTDSASFARYAAARANRRDPFYLRPAGGVDICNVPVPVRKRP